MFKILSLGVVGVIVVSLLGIVSMRHQPNTFTEQTLDNGARFTPSACWFEVPATYHVQCGWLQTAQHSAAETRFKLPVVVLHYQGIDREPDPVVYLAGGPGYAAWLDAETVSAYWFKWFDDKVALKRDVVLFDQRGSGMSQPDLSCTSFRELGEKLLTAPGTPQANADAYHAANQACFTELQQKGIDVSGLSTATSAHDVSDLLTLLGYQQWNLLGVSYGTRLAYEVQHLFPKQVRSMSLDSVYPPGEHLLREWPALLYSSLQRLFKYCENDSQCVAENGNLRERYQQLSQQLRTQPLTIPLEKNPVSSLAQVVLNDESLLTLVFNAQYVSHSLSGLATMIRQLQEGHTDAPLVQRYVQDYLVYHQLDPAFHEAAFWSVECHDNPVLSSEALAQRVEQFPTLSYYLPANYDACDVWQSKTAKTVLSAPTTPRQTPTLLLVGEQDPITPQRWALKSAKQHFVEGKAYLFRFAEIAHGVVDSKSCAQDLLINFIAKPEQRPRADCRFDHKATQVAGQVWSH